MSIAAQNVTLDVTSINDTIKLAQCLAHIAKPGDVIALSGDLGAGKTEFARAFVRALTDPDEDVPSPTFTLVQTYSSPAIEIWHFDLYRLEHAEDIFELGLEDALHEGVSLIEWPSRMGAYIPRERLELHITLGKDHNRRKAELIPVGGDWSERLRKCGHG